MNVSFKNRYKSYVVLVPTALFVVSKRQILHDGTTSNINKFFVAAKSANRVDIN